MMAAASNFEKPNYIEYLNRELTLADDGEMIEFAKSELDKRQAEYGRSKRATKKRKAA